MSGIRTRFLLFEGAHRLSRSTLGWGRTRGYLDKLLLSTSTVEIDTVPWEEEWEYPEVSRREVTTQFFGGDAFKLRRHELLIVTSRPTSHCT